MDLGSLEGRAVNNVYRQALRWREHSGKRRVFPQQTFTESLGAFPLSDLHGWCSGCCTGSSTHSSAGEFIILMRTLSPVSSHFYPNTLPSEDHGSGLPDELSISFLKIPSMPKYHLLKLTCFVCWTILTCPYRFPSAHTGLFSWNALLWFLHRHKTTSAQWYSKAFWITKTPGQWQCISWGLAENWWELSCFVLGCSCMSLVYFNCLLTQYLPLIFKDRDSSLSTTLSPWLSQGPAGTSRCAKWIFRKQFRSPLWTSFLGRLDASLLWLQSNCLNEQRHHPFLPLRH